MLYGIQEEEAVQSKGAEVNAHSLGGTTSSRAPLEYVKTTRCAALFGDNVAISDHMYR